MKCLALALMIALAPPAADEAAKKQLLALDATWNDLRLKPDVPGLDRLLLEDWTLTHSDGKVQDKSEYLAELRTRTRANHAIVNEDVAVRIHGDTGVVTGTSVQSGVSNGQPFSGRFRFTRVWARAEGGWRMLASHSSRITPAP
jgi:hypothetical protein